MIWPFQYPFPTWPGSSRRTAWDSCGRNEEIPNKVVVCRLVRISSQISALRCLQSHSKVDSFSWVSERSQSHPLRLQSMGVQWRPPSKITACVRRCHTGWSQAVHLTDSILWHILSEDTLDYSAYFSRVVQTQQIPRHEHHSNSDWLRGTKAGIFRNAMTQMIPPRKTRCVMSIFNNDMRL